MLNGDFGGGNGSGGGGDRGTRALGQGGASGGTGGRKPSLAERIRERTTPAEQTQRPVLPTAKPKVPETWDVDLDPLPESVQRSLLQMLQYADSDLDTSIPAVEWIAKIAGKTNITVLRKVCRQVQAAQLAAGSSREMWLASAIQEMMDFE